LIYGGSGRPLTAVRFEKDGAAVVAKQLWENAEAALQFNTPVGKDGNLFGVTANNDFFAIDKSGKTTWTAPVTPVADRATSASGGETPAATAAGGARGLEGGPGREGRGGPGGAGGRGGRGGGRGGCAQIVDAGTVLLALTPAAELIVLQPNPQAYTEVARLKVASSPTYAYPVVSGKRIFVKDQDDVTLFTVE